MAQEVGKVSIKLALTGQKEAESQAKTAGVNIGKAVSVGASIAQGVARDAITYTMTAISTAVSAITAITTASVKLYGDYEQALGGVQTMYDDASEEIEAFAKEAYRTSQISTTEYMEQATRFSARLIQGLEGDVKKAAELTDMAIQDMSDNANKFGTSLTTIQNTYQSLARGQYTMLDNLNLGYGQTKSEMERLLADAEKISGIKYDISNYADIVQAIHIIQEELEIAGTTGKEAFDTLQGSFRMLKSSLKDLATGLADPEANLDELVNHALESANAFAKNIIPTITRILKNITPTIVKLGGNILTELAKSSIELAPVFVQAVLDLATVILQDATELLPILADGIRNLLSQIVDYIPTFLPVLFEFMIGIAEQVAEILPNIIGSLVEGIMMIVQFLVQPENMTRIIQAGIKLLMALIEALPVVLDALMYALPDIIDAIVKFYLDKDTQEKLMIAFLECLYALVMAVPRILNVLFGAFYDLFKTLWERLKTTFGEFAGEFGKAFSASFKGALNGVIKFVEGFINKAVGMVNGFVGSINTIISAVGGHINPLPSVSLPRLAQGGLATSATPALIGESGKEAVIPLERNQDNWAGLLASKLAEEFNNQDSMADRPITIVMNNTINNDMDTDEMCNKLTTALRRAV